MSDPYVRPVDVIADMDERQIRIGVDYDSVSIGFGGVSVRLDEGSMEELMRALTTAAWQAGTNARQMAEEMAGD